MPDCKKFKVEKTYKFKGGVSDFWWPMLIQATISSVKQSKTHYNQWCCLHWMGHDKSPTVNCCRVLFMTNWHKFQMIFNGRFVMSGVDKPSFVPQMFFSFVFIHHLYLSVVARLMSVMCTDERSLLASWVDTPLTADWLQVCFGTWPDSVF